MLLLRNLNDKGKFLKGTVQQARTIYGTSSSTIFNVWKRYRLTCDELGLGGDYLRKKVHNKHKLKTHEALLARIKFVPDEDRRTIRTAACALGITKTTLHRMINRKTLVKQNIHAKPFLRKDNQVRRVEYILEHIDSLHMFHNFYNEVHVDEKWFSLFKVKQRVILHPLEERRTQKCASKRYVPKIMFLAAVARPRFDHHSKT